MRHNLLKILIICFTFAHVVIKANKEETPIHVQYMPEKIRDICSNSPKEYHCNQLLNFFYCTLKCNSHDASEGGNLYCKQISGFDLNAKMPEHWHLAYHIRSLLDQHKHRNLNTPAEAADCIDESIKALDTIKKMSKSVTFLPEELRKTCESEPNNHHVKQLIEIFYHAQKSKRPKNENKNNLLCIQDEAGKLFRERVLYFHIRELSDVTDICNDPTALKQIINETHQALERIIEKS